MTRKVPKLPACWFLPARTTPTIADTQPPPRRYTERERRAQAAAHEAAAAAVNKVCGNQHLGTGSSRRLAEVEERMRAGVFVDGFNLQQGG